MQIMPYKPKEDYDDGLKLLAKSATTFLRDQNDDNLIIAIGPRNTGKSMLMLHMMQMFMGKEASVDYIGLNRQQFAEALKRAKDKPNLPRFCANDEANISKRDAMTKFNKRVIDLYYSIRGLKIFHFWCNPSLDMLDKPFIEELVKGIILITDKSDDRPRVYYYFRKKGILKILNKYGDLKLDTIKKVRKKYSWYRGWFRDYDGPLRAAYEEKKTARMNFKVDDFFNEYGNVDDKLSRKELKTALGISNDVTLWNYEQKLTETGALKENDIRRTATGRVFYSKECLKKFEDMAKENLKRGVSNLN